MPNHEKITNDHVRVIEALEKQIPKKPKNIGGELFCPICDWHMGHNWRDSHETDPYCRHCGQAIDWSDVK